LSILRKLLFSRAGGGGLKPYVPTPSAWSYFNRAVECLPEDFTTFEEVDPGGHISVLDVYHVDFRGYRNESAYLVSDKGAGYFTDFTHKFDSFLYDDGVGTWAIQGLYAVSTVKGSGEAMGNSIRVCWYLDHGSSPKVTRIYLLGDGITQYWSPPVGHGYWLYFTLTKSGTAVTLKIYNDSGRSVLLATLSGTLSSALSFRYVYGCFSTNTGHLIWGRTQNANLDLCGGV